MVCFCVSIWCFNILLNYRDCYYYENWEFTIFITNYSICFRIVCSKRIFKFTQICSLFCITAFNAYNCLFNYRCNGLRLVCNGNCNYFLGNGNILRNCYWKIAKFNYRFIFSWCKRYYVRSINCWFGRRNYSNFARRSNY